MMLYAHGGGFTLGQSEDTAYITSRIAAENGMVLVSVNCRLAPEWPFPACLDDCLVVLQWMQKNEALVGGDGARIAVGGDSAGGNIAAALPLQARDAGMPLPQAAVLLAPITDFFFEQYESFERLAPLGIVYDSGFHRVHPRRLSGPRKELGTSVRQPDACRSARISPHVHRHRHG
jgi:acetyl esterase/lipase